MKAEGRRQKAEGSGAEQKLRWTLRSIFLRFAAAFRLPPSAFRLPPFAFCLLPFAFCLFLLPSAFAESLTLADCLRETAEANPAVVAQQFVIQQAYGQRLAFRARALPTLTAAGIAGYQGAQTSEVLKTGGVQTTTARQSTVIAVASGEISQSIFDVSIPPAWRLGTLGVTAARQNLYTIATAQLFRARTLFNRAIYYREREALLRLTDQIIQGNLKAQKSLLAVGLGTRQGVLSAQVQRANFDPTVTANTGTYRTTLATLLQVMGRDLPAATGKGDPLDAFTLVGSLDDSPLSFDPAAAAREALDHRPDLDALRATMRIYDENAKLVNAGRFPTVKIYVAGQYLPQTYVQSQNASSRASDRVQTTEIRPGVRGDWAVIDTGAILGQSRQFEALRQTIGASLSKLEQAIPSDLATVHGQAAAARESLVSLGSNVNTAQDTLNIIQAGIAQGVNSQLEFLDAQNGVYITRLSRLESQLALSQTHAEFDRITGRYLRFVTDPRHPHPATSAK